jgi:pimeloyl-ACP methyl ester carboxylesterase
MAMQSASGTSSPTLPFANRFLSAQDGLSLHYRDYGPRGEARLPLVCLPGLARTAADFHDVALALASHRHRPRRIVALDYRGRGRSAFDTDWRNYSLHTELADVQAVLAAAGIPEAVFLGTSRGGILTMMMAMSRGGAVKAAILNDIGGRIEGAGLARIRGYVGRLPIPASWNEAVDLLKRVSGKQFTGLSDADWRVYADRTFVEESGRFRLAYDPALSKTLESLDLEKPVPVLWPYFDCLKHVPVLSIRGENSDLLSEETQAEMAARHPQCQTMSAAGQGHAPMLTDKASIGRIAAFCAEVDDRP